MKKRKVKLIDVYDGIKVFHLNDGSEKVDIIIHVDIGSSIENENNQGMSHFLEHTTFCGTKKYPTSFKINEAFSKTGAMYNAHTSFDETAYYISCLKEDFDYNFKLLLHIFFDSVFPENEIEREKKPVLSEIRGYEDQPAWFLNIETIYNSYGVFPTVGNAEIVSGFDSETIKKFRESFYSHDKIRIGIQGDVSSGKILKIIKTIKSPFKKESGKNDTSPKIFTPGKTKVETTTNDCYYNRVYNLNNYNLLDDDKKRSTVALLADVLGGTPFSRLENRIRSKEGLSCYYVGASLLKSKKMTFLGISGGVDYKELEKFISLIDEEIDKLKISNSELEKFKKNRMMHLLSTHDDRWESLIQIIRYDVMGKIFDLDKTIKTMKSVTVSDINKILKDNIFSDYHEGYTTKKKV